MKIIFFIVTILSLGLTEPPSGNNQNYLSPQQTYGPPGYTPGDPIGPSSDSDVCPPNNPDANKELIKKYYQESLGDHNVNNAHLYMHMDRIEHNPLVADGLDAFKAALMGPLGQGPKTQLDFKHISAIDDLVWVHLPLPLLGKIYATMDIFRFECGKIKEHWDVLQDTELAVPSANPHPFF